MNFFVWSIIERFAKILWQYFKLSEANPAITKIAKFKLQWKVPSYVISIHLHRESRALLDPVFDEEAERSEVVSEGDNSSLGVVSSIQDLLRDVSPSFFCIALCLGDLNWLIYNHDKIYMKQHHHCASKCFWEGISTLYIVMLGWGICMKRCIVGLLYTIIRI